MKKILLVLGIVLIVVLAGIGGVLTYVSTALPDVGEAPELKIEYTPERIERGRYLAMAVNVCIDCHSTRDWTKFSGPVKEGTLGQGGERFGRDMGLPGEYYSRNITPAGIGQYTDGELFRAITAGVDRTGHALFPIMPYMYYGRMDDEDVYSVIAFIRTLAPIENSVPAPESDFPMNFILNLIPTRPAPMKKPDPSDTLAYGGYLANASGCVECHTPFVDGQIVVEKAFSGGREFPLPDGSVVRTANITTDAETGIGKWSRKAFIARFKMYADSSYVLPTVGPGDFNTMMPWTMYCNMTEQDLSAIYTYLRSVKPISNAVVKFTPATP